MVLALLLAVTAVACEPERPPLRVTTPTVAPPPLTGCRGTSSTTTRNIRYASAPGVDPNLLSLDLTVPVRGGRCGPAPVVVWVHGGGFTVGDKANGMTDKVRWAVEQGWALASVNHRLSPRVDPPPPGRVVHPTHVSDVAGAVAWLVANAPARKIDPTRILLVGHSAGAFLVSLLATDPTYLAAAGVDPGRIRAAASLDTRYDIAAAIADRSDTAELMYRNAFGDDPAVWTAASPLTHARTAGVPPFVVVTRGTATRRADTATFAAAIRAGGGSATVVDARPLDHEGVNAAFGKPGDTRLTPQITAVFRAALDHPFAQRR